MREVKVVVGNDGKLLGFIFGEVVIDRRDFDEFDEFCFAVVSEIQLESCRDTTSAAAVAMIEADDRRLRLMDGEMS